MQDYDATAGSSPALSSRAARVGASLALLAVAILVTVPAYMGLPSQALTIAYRFGLPILWGGLALAATRNARLAPARSVLLSLFGVSLGFALAYIVGERPLGWLGLSSTTPQGAAVAKLSDVILMCAAIFLAAFLARRSLGSLGLRKGRLWLSLGLGLLSTAPLLVLLAVDPAGTTKALLAVPAATILSWLPWIVLFSVANGFMEELWFRGSWLGAFRDVIGTSAAMHVTSVAFAAVHVIVYWDQPITLVQLAPVWLYMGYAYALIVRKTGSLWGAVLAHAIADVLFCSLRSATAGCCRREAAQRQTVESLPGNCRREEDPSLDSRGKARSGVDPFRMTVGGQVLSGCCRHSPLPETAAERSYWTHGAEQIRGRPVQDDSGQQLLCRGRCHPRYGFLRMIHGLLRCWTTPPAAPAVL